MKVLFGTTWAALFFQKNFTQNKKIAYDAK